MSDTTALCSVSRLKGRGSLTNPANRFSDKVSELDEEYSRVERAGSGKQFGSNAAPLCADESSLLATDYIEQPCQSIVSRNSSPDIPFNLSINPYQGCEHGCIYCYARPTHEYLDLSAGLDFETKIHVKTNANERLISFLSRPAYRCEPIVIGANTDPYQQCEKDYELTREMLATMLRFRQPVSLITKGSLLLRDLDLLSALARKNLVSVSISLTTLTDNLKRILEPRAAAPATRLKMIAELKQAGIPVSALLAPVIPAINDMEIEHIVAGAADAGASRINYILLRLPHQLKALYDDWLQEHFPQRRQKALHLLQQCHDGQLYRATFNERQRGSGVYARMIQQRFSLACQRHGMNRRRETPIRSDLFRVPDAAGQFDLFEE